MWLLSMGKRSWKSERDLLTLKLNNIRQKTLVALNWEPLNLHFMK